MKNNIPCCDFTYDETDVKPKRIRRHKKKCRKYNQYERKMRHKWKLERDAKSRPYDNSYMASGCGIKIFYDHGNPVGYVEKYVDSHSGDGKAIKRYSNKKIRQRQDELPSGSYYKKLYNISWNYMW